MKNQPRVNIPCNKVMNLDLGTSNVEIQVTID